MTLQRGQGNIIGHGQQEHRFRCLVCGHTFAATKGTPFYGLRTPAAIVALVLSLLGHG
jgi:transposase-like protein